jgi:hypothetical protein
MNNLKVLDFNYMLKSSKVNKFFEVKPYKNLKKFDLFDSYKKERFMRNGFNEEDIKNFDKYVTKAELRRDDETDGFNGNRNFYEALIYIIDNDFDIASNISEFNIVNGYTQEAFDSYYLRTAVSKSTDPLLKSTLRKNIFSTYAISENIMSKISENDNSQFLLKTMLTSKEFKNDFEIKRNKTSKVVEKAISSIKKYSPSSRVKLVKMGILYVLKIQGRTFYFSYVHLTRLVAALKAISYIFLDVELKKIIDLSRFKKIITQFIEFMLLKDYEDKIPQTIKLARSLLITDNAGISFEGKSMSQWFEAVSDEKILPSARRLLENIQTSTVFTFNNDIFKDSDSRVTFLLNVLSIFKLFPQPDYNIGKSFSDLDGLKFSNSVSKNHIYLFRGECIRRIYISMLSVGYNPQLENASILTNKKFMASGAIDTRPLIEMSVSPSVNASVIEKFSRTIWSRVSFKKNDVISDIVGKDIEPHDKSSFINEKMAFDEFVELTSDKKKFVKLFHNVNDLEQFASNESQLNITKAMSYFEHVVDEFELYENQLGKEESDITSEDVKGFVEKNFRSCYVVNTEPKAGEKHKTDPRFFYIPEPKQKCITQMVERITKQITRGQYGVSIVKDSKKRRRELEAAALSKKEGIDNRYFVSFDMTKFSRNFNHTLMVVYGSILADLTGYYYLKRLDVVFKASTVVTLVPDKVLFVNGILGCFEGFFNFVWSSIHAVIMSIALDTTGYRSIFYVYSDDGLAILYGNKHNDKESISQIVTKIQTVYKSFGLSFNLGKTIISKRIFEYLGEIGLDGELIPLFYKEMSSLFEVKKTTAFEPVSDILDKLDGKARSLTSAGSPSRISYIYLVMEYRFLMKRKGINCNYYTFLLAIITPRSYGGVRCPSPEELSSSSNIDMFGHFISDLTCLMVRDLNLYVFYSKFLNTKTDASKNPSLDILLGRYITSKLETITSTKNSNLIKDALIDRYPKLAKYKRKNYAEVDMDLLYEVIQNIKPLEPSVLNYLYNSAPSNRFVTFMESLTKNQTLMKYINRSPIKRVQRYDSLKFSRIVSRFRVTPRDLKAGGQVAIENPMSLARMLIKASYPSLTIRVPRMGVIGLFALSSIISENIHDIGKKLKDSFGIIEEHSNPDSKAILGFHKANENIYMESHGVNIYKYPKTGTKMDWKSELGPVDFVKDTRKFYSALYRIIHYANAGLINDLCVCFKVPKPGRGIAPFLTDIHRLGNQRGYDLDTRYNYPNYVQTTTYSKLSEAILRFIPYKDSLDRTTYSEAFKWLTYIYFASELEGDAKEAKAEIYISKEIFFYICTNVQVSYQERFAKKDITVDKSDQVTFNGIKNDFIEMLNDTVDHINDLATVNNLSSEVSSRDEETILNIVIYAKNKIARYARKVLKNPDLNAVISVPPFLTPYDVIYSLLDAILSTLDPKTIKELNKFYIIGMTSVSELINSRDIVESIVNRLNIILQRMNIPSNIGTFIPTKYDDISESFAEILRTSITGLLISRNISKHMITQVVVLKGINSRSSLFTESHADAMHNILSNYKSFLYTESTSIKRLKNRGPDKEMIPFKSIDEVIDMVTISLDVVRKSPHRSTAKPYNTDSMKIYMIKYYSYLMSYMRGYMINQIYKSIQRGEKTYLHMRKVLKDKIPEDIFVKACKHLLDEKYGKKDSVGRDHLIIKDLDLTNQQKKRASIIIDAVKNRTFIPDYKEEFFRVIDSDYKKCASKLFQYINSLQTYYYDIVIKTCTSLIKEISFGTKEGFENFITPSEGSIILVNLEEPSLFKRKSTLDTRNFLLPSHEDINLAVDSFIYGNSHSCEVSTDYINDEFKISDVYKELETIPNPTEKDFKNIIAGKISSILGVSFNKVKVNESSNLATGDIIFDVSLHVRGENNIYYNQAVTSKITIIKSFKGECIIIPRDKTSFLYFAIYTFDEGVDHDINGVDNEAIKYFPFDFQIRSAYNVIKINRKESSFNIIQKDRFDDLKSIAIQSISRGSGTYVSNKLTPLYYASDLSKQGSVQDYKYTVYVLYLAHLAGAQIDLDSEYSKQLCNLINNKVREYAKVKENNLRLINDINRVFSRIRLMELKYSSLISNSDIGKGISFFRSPIKLNDKAISSLEISWEKTSVIDATTVSYDTVINDIGDIHDSYMIKYKDVGFTQYIDDKNDLDFDKVPSDLIDYGARNNKGNLIAHDEFRYAVEEGFINDKSDEEEEELTDLKGKEEIDYDETTFIKTPEDIATRQGETTREVKEKAEKKTPNVLEDYMEVEIPENFVKYFKIPEEELDDYKCDDDDISEFLSFLGFLEENEAITSSLYARVNSGLTGLTVKVLKPTKEIELMKETDKRVEIVEEEEEFLESDFIPDDFKLEEEVSIDLSTHSSDESKEEEEE